MASLTGVTQAVTAAAAQVFRLVVADPHMGPMLERRGRPHVMGLRAFFQSGRPIPSRMGDVSRYVGAAFFWGAPETRAHEVEPPLEHIFRA